MPRIPSTLCLSQLGLPWKKYCIFNGLNNGSLLSHNSEGWKSEIMVPAWSNLVGFCESSVLACKWPPSCCVFVCYFHGAHTGKNKRSLSLSSYSYKTTNSIMRALSSQPHLTLVTLLTLLSSNIITLVVKTSNMICGRWAQTFSLQHSQRTALIGWSYKTWVWRLTKITTTGLRNI